MSRCGGRIGVEGRLLLQRRVDNGLWAMPGGMMEMTESLPQAAVREVREAQEAGVQECSFVCGVGATGGSADIRSVATLRG